MKKYMIGLCLAIIGGVFVSCASPSSMLFDDEFDSLNGDIWSTQPNLTPFEGLEGSNIPGEVKVENGILKLSRYAPELAGENAVSSIQTRSMVNLPSIYSVTIRSKNEFVGFEIGQLFVAMYKDQIWVGHSGVYGPQEDSFKYHSNNDSYFILSLHVTSSGYTVSIKEDVPNAIEETFSKNLDLSKLSGDSIITIMGGSNTTSTPYSEIDYIRISH
jgi:hypothetical protein